MFCMPIWEGIKNSRRDIENAEGIKVHLDNLKLRSGDTASEYINSFLTLSDELSKINLVNIFDDLRFF